MPGGRSEGRSEARVHCPRLTPPFAPARGHGAVPVGVFKIPDRRGDQALLPEQKQESLTYFFTSTRKEKNGITSIFHSKSSKDRENYS